MSARPDFDADADAPRAGRMRFSVHKDDYEMQVIQAHLNQILQKSAQSRGHVRRTAGPAFLRQLLVAGWRHLYGPFPLPDGYVTPYPGVSVGAPATPTRRGDGPAEPAVETAPPSPSPSPEAPSAENARPHDQNTDMQTEVAKPATITEDTAQPHAPRGNGAAPAQGLDFGSLLGGGDRVISGSTTTETL